MTIDIAELFARREHERDAPRQNPKIRHRTAVQTNFISRKVALGSKTEIRAATRCFRFSPDCVEKSPFSLMTENSQDRWCVSFAARGTT